MENENYSVRTFGRSDRIDSSPAAGSRSEINGLHGGADGVMRQGMTEVKTATKMEEHAHRVRREAVDALAAAVEAKDRFTLRHSQTVGHYSAVLAARIGLDPERLANLGTAALLHDLGKIAVPDNILQKPGPLTSSEFDQVKRHPQTAVEILGGTTFLEAELPIILYHHEWYDGSGYPYGARGEEIPLEARVLAVADAIDCMFSPRCYKRGYDRARVSFELRTYAGRQFDPDVTRVALDWLETDHGV